MKMKLCLRYLIYIILILIIMFGGRYILNPLQKNIHSVFDVYIFNLLLIVLFAGTGALLGIENLLLEIRKKGSWKINFYKLGFIGIPALYFSLAYFIYYSDNEFIRSVIAYPISILIGSKINLIVVFQLIFGYSIITSFYKSNESSMKIIA